MTMALQAKKRWMRAQVRAALAAMNVDEQAHKSAQACALLQQQPAWKLAKNVLLYAPLAQELDVWPLLDRCLREGKTAALPRFSSPHGLYRPCLIQEPATQIQTGKFGIREPSESCAELELNRLDFFLVPGIAFDLRGRRLGRGKGHYDLLLHSARGKICGVAFDEQIVHQVPVEPHDVTLNCILTPTRWIEL